MSALQTLIDAIALGSLYALVAMGIGLVFGVLRLINFAHGELLTAGAYTLARTNDLPVGVSIAACFGVVITLALLMEVTYRPLRGSAPATMLVTTFAVSFLLQAVALLAFGSLGENVGVIPELNRAVSIGDLRIRWVTIASVCIGILLLAGTALVIGKTSIGLQMRAAAVDFRTARLLGVRANNVIRFAFLLAGILAASAVVMLTVQRPLATPTYGFQLVIPALVGVVVGGIDRLGTATLGGFAIGFATAVLGDVLPAEGRVFLDTALFLLVILVLVLRPSGLFSRSRGAWERV